MNEKEFIEKYRSEKEMFYAWGKFIKATIEEKIDNIIQILKIGAEPRIKDEDSIIAKAFYRGKNYLDPYNDITDKVGIRFVVLTETQIKIIKDIIENTEEWSYSEDVDYEKSIEEKPELFTYKSVHYIVRNKKEISYNDILIKRDTPCEIQIRTLLQHAYAELSHDTVYKKEREIDPVVKRRMARSMALIETTDQLFVEVQELLNQEEKLYNQILNTLVEYTGLTNYTDSFNRYIFDAYNGFIKEKSISKQDIIGYMEEVPYIKGIITQKAKFDIVYRQPIICMIYFLLKNFQNNTIELWPLDEKILEDISVDIGISLESSY